jgi:uncharacterized protein YbaA (DUF1428 family)
MRYVEGFVVPVPDGNKAAYLASANNMTSLLKRLGATRVVERWGSDIAEGTAGNGESAIGAQSGESVVVGWVEWPSKEARDEASRRSKVLPDPAIA